MATIDNGANKINKIYKDKLVQATVRDRQNLFNRLHIILVQASGNNKEETKKWLPALEAMNAEEREAAILEKFGVQVLERCKPALQQVATDRIQVTAIESLQQRQG